MLQLAQRSKSKSKTKITLLFYKINVQLFNLYKIKINWFGVFSSIIEIETEKLKFRFSIPRVTESDKIMGRFSRVTKSFIKTPNF